jgi:hypothetical protein
VCGVGFDSEFSAMPSSHKAAYVVKDEAYIAVSQQVRSLKPKLTVAADHEFETEQAVIL